MKRPNFFIVGAPKCGTTALAHYLSEHERVFLAHPKEPNFFARHLSVSRHDGALPEYQASLDGYLRLFDGATHEHVAVGEASTRYLRSSEAHDALRAFCPEVRLIVMVRNPVDLVESWHAQKVYEGQEDELDFEKAWRLQPRRAAGHGLPRGLLAKDALLYGQIGCIGTQLERLASVFARHQIKVIFLDELQRRPADVYEDVLSFLRVPGDGRQRFPVVNARKTMRWHRVRRSLRRRAPAVSTAVRSLVRLVPTRAVSALPRHRLQPGPSTRVRPAFRGELTQYFRDEVDKISRFTGRSLDQWRDSH